MTDLIDKLSQWQREQDRANSISAEIRQDKGQFIEETGVNKKALTIFGQLHKMDEEKRADFFRTWDEHIEDLRVHWDNQSTPDMFDAEDAPEMTDGDEAPATDEDGNVVPFDVEIDEESAAFDEAADKAFSGAAE